jgi:hypothetical protein
LEAEECCGDGVVIVLKILAGVLLSVFVLIVAAFFVAAYADAKVSIHKETHGGWDD